MPQLPPNHQVVTPGMVCPDAAKVIAFLVATFDGKEADRMTLPSGHIAHAEVVIGGCTVMLGEPMPDAGYPPQPGMMSVYVDDVDATYRAALEAGATSEQEPKNEFYGHRVARVRDVGGNRWNIHTVIEQLSPTEMQRRLAAMGG